MSLILYWSYSLSLVFAAKTFFAVVFYFLLVIYGLETPTHFDELKEYEKMKETFLSISKMNFSEEEHQQNIPKIDTRIEEIKQERESHADNEKEKVSIREMWKN